MQFTSIRFENIGPIERAEIGRHKLCMFVGPNNSGKSIASRIMHGVCQLDPPAKAQRGISGAELRGAAESDEEEEEAARASAVLRSAGMAWRDAVTHSMASGRLEVKDGGGGLTTISFGQNAGSRRASLLASLFDGQADEGGRSSMYVPAGRTGTVQSLLAIAQLKNDLLNSLLQSLDDELGLAPGRKRPGRAGSGLRLRQRMPEHLEQFYSAMLETFSGELGPEARSLFSRLFAGSVGPSGPGGRPAMSYGDPLGFGVEIASAGSGVASAFPIVAAMYRVGPGGTLIVEEPEEHTEPVRQIRLVREIFRAAAERGVGLVLTTHSDYVVHAVLGMVFDEALDPADLGLYHFRRRRGSYTRVERVHVNRAGEAELDMFDEALDAIAKGGRVPADP